VRKVTFSAEQGEGVEPKALSKHNTVVLFWRSLGPYHVARAEATAALFEQRGAKTVAMELCDGDEMHQWRVDRSRSRVEIRTVAPGVRLFNHLPSWGKEVVRQLDELRPCCVAVAGYSRPEERAAIRWANRNGAVAVLMSETKWDDRPRRWWRRAYAARVMRRVDACLVSGGASGEYFVSLGMPREMIFRQYGAVDNDYFARTVAEIRRGEPELCRAGAEISPDENGRSRGGRPCFMACGRLVEVRKNLVRLLLAYQSYRDKLGQEPWDLVICGDGPDRGLLEGVVAERRIEGVEFAGFCQVDALARHYARASCFIHPAMNEAWGLVVNEAMAAGLPVLVSRRCGCAYDLVHEGRNGWTFNPYDIEELAELMLRMSSMSPDKLAAQGSASQQIVARFGPERFAEGLAQAIDAVERLRKPGGNRWESQLKGIPVARGGVRSDGPTYSPGSGDEEDRAKPRPATSGEATCPACSEKGGAA